MKKNINLQLSYYLIILFFFAVFFLFQKHHVANDSTISEWLINYEGGFTKRGLIGQISFYIANLVSVDLRDTIFTFQILTVGIYFLLIYFFLKNIEVNKILIFAIFTPIFILYPIAEIEVLARKELFVFIYLLAYSFIPLRKKNHKFFYKLIFFPIVVLIWEPVVFFILFLFFLDLIENKINKVNKKFFVQIFSYVPGIVVAIYIALNPISEENHALMANSLLENFNEKCYMSCELLKTKSSLYQQFEGNLGRYSFVILFRYFLIFLIGFGPLFLLLLNSKPTSDILFFKMFKNLFFPFLILLSPIVLLFAMGYDWGRWVNIGYFFSITTYIYMRKNNMIHVSYNFLEKNIFKKINKKIFITLIIFYCFGWNPKTVMTGDVASFPGYRIPYKALKITLKESPTSYFKRLIN